MRFRTLLIGLMLTVLAATVTAVAITSLMLGRSTAEDLTVQLAEQNLELVEKELLALLEDARTSAHLASQPLVQGDSIPDNFPLLQEHFSRILAAYPRITYLGWAVAETGDYFFVERRRTKSGEQLRIREYVGGADGDAHRVIRDFDIFGKALGPEKKWNLADYDPRTRPFYQLAESRGKASWTQTYVFVSDGERGEMPGVSYALPVYDGEGELWGVIDADFDLYAICNFLNEIQTNEESDGRSFVLEQRDNEDIRLIAHPDPHMLLYARVGEAGEPKHELAPTVAKAGDVAIAGYVRGLGTIAEDAFEPVLTDVDEVEDRHKSYVASHKKVGGNELPNWSMGYIVPRDELYREVNSATLLIVLVGVAALVLGAVIATLVAARISRPLASLAVEADEIGAFNLEKREHRQTSVRELERLQSSFEEMKAGLRSFQKYVPADLVKSALTSGRVVELGGRRANVSVLFSDIVGFTSISEKSDPEALIQQLGEYLETMASAIRESAGTVDKYIGDAVMALWGAPRILEDHAVAACRAALACHCRTASLNKKWAKEGRPVLHTRIGINSGDAVVGNMGSKSRMAYTAVGDTVNLAARLEGLCKAFGVSTIIGSATSNAAGDAILTRLLDRVAVKGREGGVAVYQLIGMQGDELPTHASDVIALYNAAYTAYSQREWQEALKNLEVLLQLDPEDGPAQALQLRCYEFLFAPPPDGWDGTHTMQVK